MQEGTLLHMIFLTSSKVVKGSIPIIICIPDIVMNVIRYVVQISSSVKNVHVFGHDYLTLCIEAGGVVDF